LGLLRREIGGAAQEAATGSALGLLAWWGAGWSSWLPLAGVHASPWRQQTPKVLLPCGRSRSVRRGLGSGLLGASP
jgi:hypothetical protein